MQADKQRRSPRARYAGLGFELAAAAVGFGAFGYWLGGYYGSPEKGLLIGASLGIFGGMYNLIRASLAISRGSELHRPKSDGKTEDR